MARVAIFVTARAMGVVCTSVLVVMRHGNSVGTIQGKATTMDHLPLDPEDWALVEAAREVIRRNFWPERHAVGAALRCPSGRIYTGVNVSGAGVCAEMVAIGSAISAGEREFACVAAVEGWTEARALVPPCGRCRQVFADYAPEICVLLLLEGEPVKVRLADLLPLPYLNFDDRYTR